MLEIEYCKAILFFGKKIPLEAALALVAKGNCDQLSA